MNELLVPALHSLDGCLIAADGDGVVTFVNRQAADAIGCDERDVVGRTLADVFCVTPSFDIASDARVILTTKQGTSRIVEHSIGPIVDDAGDVRGTVVSFRDVGERLERDEERALSERLATVATIAAGVAHELNNPLAAVESNLRFAREELRDLSARSPKLAPLLVDAGDALVDGAAAAARVKQIVQQLKIFLFADAGPAHVDVNEAVALALRLMATSLASASVEVKSESVPRVLCDEGQLVQCFMNVLKNALQAVADKPGANHIAVTTSLRAPYAIIAISDDGVGISERHLGRIFEPFFTTRDPGDGVGLGLSIARAIVLRAGGTITATSALGTGTTIEIALPLAA